MQIPIALLLATFALSIGSFMNILDSTIVNVSLSHIAGDFGVSASQGTWVITSYAVSEAILLPLTGWLSKRFGSVNLYIWGTLLFTLASILCGLSTSFEFLLFSRILQGVVGACMIPLSQTLLMSIYPPDKKGLAMGIWAMTIVIAPVAGPILGGWITDNWNWRWSFLINIPFGILSSYIVYKIFRVQLKNEVKIKAPMDYMGLIFLAVGVGALQLLLDKGNELDWFSDNYIVTLGIISFIFIGSLIIWEYYAKDPVIDVRLFLNRNFVIGVLVLCIGSTAFFSTVVVFPQWLQNYMGYTAFNSGLATSTTSIFVIFLAPILGAALSKVDPRKIVVFGFAWFFIVSWWGATMNNDVTAGHIALNRLFLGIGLACFFIPLTSITFSNIAPKDMAGAAGISSFMRNMGNSFGTSLVIAYWDRRMATHHEYLAASINPSNPNYESYINTLPMQDPTTQMAYINNIINGQAAVMGINDIMLLSGLIMLALIPFVMLAKRPTHHVEGGGH
jgi:DHA2 family multidrug resistance protein